MNKVTTIIVEDNLLNQQRLLQLIKDYCTDLVVVAVAGSVGDAISVIRDHRPELVFLDIELPDGSGFEILEYFKPIGFKVIFATGHQEYAYQAIKFNAVDFLLKPFSIRDLMDAVSKTIARQADSQYYQKLDAVRLQLSDSSRIVINESSGFTIIDINEIIKLEANGNYTDFHLKGNRKLTYYRILKEFEGMLSVYSNFMRVHRSHLVNLDHVRSYSAQGVIKLSEGHSAYLGDSFKEQFLARFE